MDRLGVLIVHWRAGSLLSAITKKEDDVKRLLRIL